MTSKQAIIFLFFVAVVMVGILFTLPRLRTSESNSGTNINSVSINKAIECEQGNDCLVGGCSGQLCLPRDKASSTMTTCEWREVYACYKVDDCICKNNKCQWEGNKAFIECLEALK